MLIMDVFLINYMIYLYLNVIIISIILLIIEERAKKGDFINRTVYLDFTKNCFEKIFTIS